MNSISQPPSSTPHGIVLWARALRPQQWVKNALLVVPLLLSHRVREGHRAVDVVLGVIAFCLAASAIYILNDLLDRKTDRVHPTKRHRPFASGALGATAGAIAGTVLLLAALLLSSLFLSRRFVLLVLAYALLAMLYSLYLKRKVMIDVLCLAALYTLRIIAGGEAAAVVVSQWLLAFSMFLFLSLAFAKRYAELNLMKGIQGGEGLVGGRGYLASDLELIRSVGPASGYLCVLVLGLYINGPDVLKIYEHPTLLWLLCPVLLYWITRIWFVAHRGQLADDPLSFALRDRISYLCGILIVVIAVVASL